MEYTIEQKNKINNNAFFLLIFLLFFSACDCPDKIPITKERLVNKILYQAARDLKEKKSLYPSGSGGCMMNKIQTIALSFSYYKPITITEGRELVIFAAQKLAEEINLETQIHSYLYEYPFPPTRADIRIFVKNLDRSLIQEGAICVVSLIDGILEYDIIDSKTDRLRTVYKETYAEGLYKLKHLSQSQKLPMNFK